MRRLYYYFKTVCTTMAQHNSTWWGKIMGNTYMEVQNVGNWSAVSWIVSNY